MSDTQNNTQPADAQQNNQSGNNGSTAGNGAKTPAASYTQEQLDSMVSAREQRAANAALKSFFEQQGMTSEEVTKAISDYKTAREKNKPDINAISAQAEKYKAAAIRAQIENKATIEAVKLGLDAATIPYVMKLADFSAVADESGAVDDEKLRNAVSQVLKDLPQLKKQTTSAGFEKIGAGENTQVTQDSTEALRKALGLKPKKT